MHSAILSLGFLLVFSVVPAAAQKTAQAGPAPRTLSTAWRLPSSPMVPLATGSQRPRVMMVGYWPPTNEMLRPWSNNKSQNPGGWTGSDWEKRGYDVYSFFPEFPSGSWPRGRGDFEVDYQDTSADFWRIVGQVKPVAIITFSRGFPGRLWEIELNAQNHGAWVNDSLNPRQPDINPPDRSMPAWGYRRSTLPAREIAAAVTRAKINVVPRLCAWANGGNFLSEYLSYHGTWYQGLHRSASDTARCVAAGHVHVGTQVTVADGTAAVAQTLREVMTHVDRVLQGKCQGNHGFGGPGEQFLTMCGTPLRSGGAADLVLAGIPANVPAILLLSPKQKPAVQSRMVVIPDNAVRILFQSDNSGRAVCPKIPGGGGPATFYAQFGYVDGRVSGGIGFSNALEVRFLR